jgi:hypothetical protein
VAGSIRRASASRTFENIRRIPKLSPVLEREVGATGTSSPLGADVAVCVNRGAARETAVLPDIGGGDLHGSDRARPLCRRADERRALRRRKRFAAITFTRDERFAPPAGRGGCGRRATAAGGKRR